MKRKLLHSMPGPTPRTVETKGALELQAKCCAAGDHVYTWSGQVVDVPGGSPHLVMACAYAAAHDPDCVSPRLIGPLLSSENMAKRLWTKEELQQVSPQV
jgi:hypothetical protein